MKRTTIALGCVLAVLLASVTAVRATDEGVREGKATVRSVHGTVEYLDNNAWVPVKPNMRFAAGVTIRTGADGSADISVNGTASAVRLTNNTTLQIPTMTYTGSMREGDTTTMLNLENGGVIGNVKKITANSRYEIMTPHGVAGVRGTDFGADANKDADTGNWHVTFSSITGVITVSAIIDGVTVTHTLTTGMSWTIGENPKLIPPQLMQVYLNQLNQLLNFVFIFGNPGGPGFHPPGNPQTPPTGFPPNSQNPGGVPGSL
jgi:hypothetical protein